MELPTEFTVTITEKNLEDAQMALLRGAARRTQVCVVAQAVKPVLPGSWVDSTGTVHLDCVLDENEEELIPDDCWKDGARVERLVDHFDNHRYDKCRTMLPMTVTFKKTR